jgi:hypothetical protein
LLQYEDKTSDDSHSDEDNDETDAYYDSDATIDNSNYTDLDNEELSPSLLPVASNVIEVSYNIKKHCFVYH